MEENPVDNIDEDTLDDVTYKVYETPWKRLNTSLEMVGKSPINLHGVPRNCRATYKHQTEIGKSCRHV